MTPHPLILPLLTASTLFLAACHSHPTPPPPSSAAWYTAPAAADGPAAIGTVKRRDLLIAYYGSNLYQTRLAGMKQEHKAALARGDTDRAAALERQGEGDQDRAHQQLAGTAPLDNILSDLRDVLPQVAAEAGVGSIVEEGGKLPADARVVDVTEALTKRLEPRRRPHVPGTPREGEAG